MISTGLSLQYLTPEKEWVTINRYGFNNELIPIAKKWNKLGVGEFRVVRITRTEEVVYPKSPKSQTVVKSRKR